MLILYNGHFSPQNNSLSSPSPGNHHSIFCFSQFHHFDASYTSRSESVLLRLAFTWYNGFQLHPCCCEFRQQMSGIKKMWYMHSMAYNTGTFKKEGNAVTAMFNCSYLHVCLQWEYELCGERSIYLCFSTNSHSVEVFNN